MDDVEQIRDRAKRLRTLELKASDNNLNDYSAPLEEIAAVAFAHAET